MLNKATIQHPHGREGQLDAKSKLSHPRRWRHFATQPKPAMLYVYEHLHTLLFRATSYLLSAFSYFFIC